MVINLFEALKADLESLSTRIRKNKKSQIDFIGISMDILSAGHVCSDLPRPLAASDHFPIIARAFTRLPDTNSYTETARCTFKGWTPQGLEARKSINALSTREGPSGWFLHDFERFSTEIVFIVPHGTMATRTRYKPFKERKCIGELEVLKTGLATWSYSALRRHARRKECFDVFSHVDLVKELRKRLKLRRKQKSVREIKALSSRAVSAPSPPPPFMMINGGRSSD